MRFEWSAIRLVALDFDGTLIETGEKLADGNLMIRDAARAAVRRATAAGVVVATASGRSLESQVDILRANGLGEPAGTPLALSVDERSLYLLRDGAYQPVQPWNDELDADWARLYPLAEQLMREFEAAARADGEETYRVLVDDEARQRGIVDIRFRSGEAEAIARREQLAARVAAVTDELMVTQNWHLVQILSAAGGKGRSLAALARALDLQPEQVLAVGDRHNDIPMLDGSQGLQAACVGNAVQEIKELVASVGGYIASDELGGGVAEILNLVAVAQGG